MRNLLQAGVEGICETCKGTFEIRAGNQKYCSDRCRKRGSRNEARTEQRRQIRTGPTEFVGVDGEGVQGRCTKYVPRWGPCACTRFRPSPTDENTCRCGHHRFDDHDHVYVLLGCGDEQIEAPDALAPADLPLSDILAFLYRRYRQNPTAAYVMFFTGYDWTQWFKQLPEIKAWLLFDEKGKERRRMRITKHPQYFPVRVNEHLGPDGGWELEMLADKRLQIRPMVCYCEAAGRHGVSRGSTKAGKASDRAAKQVAATRARGGCCRYCGAKRAPYMNICDAGPIFQTSLLQAIDPKDWSPPEDLDAAPRAVQDAYRRLADRDRYNLIARGKENRPDAQLGDEMRLYNRLENEALADLMAIFDFGLRSLGLHLGRGEWYGPGPAAAAWLANNSAPTRKAIEGDGDEKAAIVPYRVRQAALKAYFGGWFEVAGHGTVPGTSYEYDITSAYPHQIACLPCLLHGRWRHEKKRRSCLAPLDHTTQLRLVHARVRGSDPHLGAMLHRRTDGSILRPHQTEGWFWQHEIEASLRAGLIEQVIVLETWTYERCGCPPPLGVLADMFGQRILVGKNTPQGKAIKLVMNSVYGKFVQSVGTAPFRNYVWGSLTTAGTRVMILDAIATHPLRSSGVLMIATDAVYFIARHPTLPLCTQDAPVLGDWEEKGRENMTLFKPGVYWDDEARDKIRAGEDPIFKARGINRKEFGKHLDEIDADFANQIDGLLAGRELDWPAMIYTSDFGMVTAKMAVQHGHNWAEAGRVYQPPSRQRSDPTRKRTEPYFDPELGVIRTHPHDQAANLVSAPYQRKGVKAAFAVVVGEEPDDEQWAYQSPDGPVGAVVAGMLGTGQWA
jgi:hypothetical protein